MTGKFIRLKEKLRGFLAAHLSSKTRRRIKNLFFLDKKLKYGAAVQWAIQNEVCNLRCEYCRFPHSIMKVPPADVKDLLMTLEKTGKIFSIGLCGNGETFLIPNIIEVFQELTKKHYVTLVTNLTLKKIREFCEKIDPRKVISLTASLHIKELERTGLTDVFIENYLLCKKKGFNIRARVVAHPSLLNEIEKYKRFFDQKGIQLYFDDCFTDFEGKAYPYDYTDQERKAFGLVGKQEGMDQIYQKGKRCIAGYSVCTIANDGKVYPCPGVKETIGDIHQGKIEFRKGLMQCPLDKCPCPLSFHFYELFTKALTETKTRG